MMKSSRSTTENGSEITSDKIPLLGNEPLPTQTKKQEITLNQIREFKELVEFYLRVKFIDTAKLNGHQIETLKKLNLLFAKEFSLPLSSKINKFTLKDFVLNKDLSEFNIRMVLAFFSEVEEAQSKEFFSEFSKIVQPLRELQVIIKEHSKNYQYESWHSLDNATIAIDQFKAIKQLQRLIDYLLRFPLNERIFSSSHHIEFISQEEAKIIYRFRSVFTKKLKWVDEGGVLKKSSSLLEKGFLTRNNQSDSKQFMCGLLKNLHVDALEFLIKSAQWIVDDPLLNAYFARLDTPSAIQDAAPVAAMPTATTTTVTTHSANNDDDNHNYSTPVVVAITRVDQTQTLPDSDSDEEQIDQPINPLFSKEGIAAQIALLRSIINNAIAEINRQEVGITAALTNTFTSLFTPAKPPLEENLRLSISIIKMTLRGVELYFSHPENCARLGNYLDAFTTLRRTFNSEKEKLINCINDPNAKKYRYEKAAIGKLIDALCKAYTICFVQNNTESATLPTADCVTSAPNHVAPGNVAHS